MVSRLLFVTKKIITLPENLKLKDFQRMFN